MIHYETSDLLEYPINSTVLVLENNKGTLPWAVQDIAFIIGYATNSVGDLIFRVKGTGGAEYQIHPSRITNNIRGHHTWAGE